MLVAPLNLIQNRINNLNPPLKTRGSNCYADFNFQNSSLAPLKQDTISFKGKVSLNKALLEVFKNEKSCEEVYENANVACDALRKVLKRSLSPFVASSDNMDGIISKIETRIKQPDSIREKAATILEEHLFSGERTFHPSDAEAIKKVCQDIVGARAVLRKASQKQVRLMIDALIKEVEEGNLKIIGIENHCPELLDEKHQYVSKADIDRLLEAVNSNLKNGEAPVELTNVNTKSGYTALHLNLDLTNPEYKAKNAGYFGEFQIIGQDVERLKDVEDFCYKIKLGKEIKNGNIIYKPFRDYFLKHYNADKYPNIEEDFREYTLRAYVCQRMKKPPELGSKGKSNLLPSIAECEMTGKIPPALDFNNLARIKYHCDKIHALTTAFDR